MPRIIFATLGNPEHVMPHPYRAGLFPAEGLPVDAEDPNWMQLLADGSLIEAPFPQTETSDDEPAKASKRKEK